MLFSPCAEKTMSAAHQILWYRLNVCWHPQPSLSPAGSSGPEAGPEVAQGTEEQVALGYCQGQFYVCLLLQAGSIWERTSGFSSHGWFGFPGCPLPSLQKASVHLCLCCQIQMSLAFVTFCHRSSTMFWLFSFFYRCHHNEHGDICSSSFFLSLIFSFWSLIVKRRHQEIKLCSN